jgi:hypothetical protein
MILFNRLFFMNMGMGMDWDFDNLLTLSCHSSNRTVSIISVNIYNNFFFPYVLYLQYKEIQKYSDK